MQISAWWLVVMAWPVLWLGEVLVRRVGALARFNIPVPVVGGFLVALVVLGINALGWELSFVTTVGAKWWMWATTPEVRLGGRATMPIAEPLVVAFFTCIGLNASWSLAKKGGMPLIWFLVISGVLAVAQNGLGVGVCKVMGEDPLMGVLCGGVALTGGPGTAMGMSQTFVNAGFKDAAVVGMAAATFGLVGGALMGGPVATLLIRWKKVPTPRSAGGVVGIGERVEGRAAEALEGKLPGETADERRATALAAGDGEGFGAAPGGFIAQVIGIARQGMPVLVLLGVLLFCLKAGAWVSLALTQIEVNGQPISFPVYMGAMAVGIILRNALDVMRVPLLSTELVEDVASAILAVFLSMAMVSLNLMNLKSVAGSMLVLLVVQMALMVLFAVFITYPLMGRTYDAVVLTAGQIGFGFGATQNAVATMEATTRQYGPSPKSFLIVTIVGGFLIDVINMWVTIGFLWALK
jgi:ESS family glutamate:Na+ symporter